MAALLDLGSLPGIWKAFGKELQARLDGLGAVKMAVFSPEFVIFTVPADRAVQGAAGILGSSGRSIPRPCALRALPGSPSLLQDNNSGLLSQVLITFPCGNAAKV